MSDIGALGGAKEIIPGRRGALITPSDSDVFTNTTRAVIVGTAGDLKVRFIGGDVIIIPSSIVNAMVELPIAVDMIYSTGTAASEILALW